MRKHIEKWAKNKYEKKTSKIEKKIVENGYEVRKTVIKKILEIGQKLTHVMKEIIENQWKSSENYENILKNLQKLA